MTDFETVKRIWGLRKADQETTATSEVEVIFDFNAWSLGGCPTCGPEIEKEFSVLVLIDGRTVYSQVYTSWDFDEAFTTILSEMVAIAKELEI